MKPSKALAAFYRETITEQNREARRLARLDPTISREDPVFDREEFEPDSHAPYSANGKRPRTPIVVGYRIGRTLWTALSQPYKRSNGGRYSKLWLVVQCECGKVAERRLDTLVQLRPDGKVGSRSCRKCSSMGNQNARKGE